MCPSGHLTRQRGIQFSLDQLWLSGLRQTLRGSFGLEPYHTPHHTPRTHICVMCACVWHCSQIRNELPNFAARAPGVHRCVLHRLVSQATCECSLCEDWVQIGPGWVRRPLDRYMYSRMVGPRGLLFSLILNIKMCSGRPNSNTNCFSLIIRTGQNTC